MFYQIILRLAGAALCLATMSAWGCMEDQPPVVRTHLILPVTAEELSLTRLDLLTIALPSEHPESWRIEMEPMEPPIMQAVPDVDFEGYLRSKRFITVTRRSADPLTGSATAARLHFGAAGAGSMTLKLLNEQFHPARTYTMHIKVNPVVIPPPPPRGRVISFEAGQPGAPIEIGFYDKLEITLPGSVADEWHTSSASAVGLELIGKRPADVGGGVIFTFGVHGTNSQSGTMLLVPKHRHAGQAAVYQFQIRHVPVPAC